MVTISTDVMAVASETIILGEDKMSKRSTFKIHQRVREGVNGQRRVQLHVMRTQTQRISDLVAASLKGLIVEEIANELDRRGYTDTETDDIQQDPGWDCNCGYRNHGTLPCTKCGSHYPACGCGPCMSESENRESSRPTTGVSQEPGTEADSQTPSPVEGKTCPKCGARTYRRKGVHFDSEWLCNYCDLTGEFG